MRTWSTVFGLGVLAMTALGLAGVLPHVPLTFVPTLLLQGIAFTSIAVLFAGLLQARRRARLLEAHAREFRLLAQKFEASLATVSAMNGRLHESEARYKGLVDAQGDAILRRAPDSRLTYGNDAFLKLFGLNASEALGRAFAPESHPDSNTVMPPFGTFAGRDSGHQSGQAHARYDQHVRTAFGWRWIAWEDYAITDTLGRLIEVQSVGRDITERKALEDALTKARDDAEAGSRAKSGFLATMSHEIRTPMNGVLGMARLLLETKLGPDQRTYVSAIKQSGESLLALIEKILDFSKIESGTMRLEEDDVEVRPLVEGVVELLASRAHAKDIELLAIIENDVPALIRGDTLRLGQILTNLVGNAIKFTEKGGVRIDVRVEHRGRRYLSFVVRDTGVGVPRDKRTAIFDEFVQGDSSHARRFGGTGLGLAISKRLVLTMGGHIGVDAAPGGGSIFWFVIPAVSLKRADPIEATRLKGSRVAIVTRNAVLREGLTAQVRTAGGDVAAMWIPGESDGGKLDAIIIDAGAGAEPDLPTWPDEHVRSIVLITPDARPRIAELKRMGFDAYLVKPVRQQSICERIRAKEEMIIPPAPPDLAPLPHTRVLNAGRSGVTGTADILSAPDARAHVTAQESSQEGAQNARGPSGNCTAKPLHILLLEDNPVNALLTRELMRRRGHTVTDVVSGEIALEVLTCQSFDLVITDIHMPGLDGFETAERIRLLEQRHNRARTPIVALTADMLETGARKCEAAGMDGYLTKPVDPKDLDAIFARLFPADAEDAAA
jgi:PAS domain S-box-containing protein